MIGRLANVLYWVGCGLSAMILFGMTGLAYFNTGSFQILAFTAPIALLIWLLGRAIRYVLAGE